MQYVAMGQYRTIAAQLNPVKTLDIQEPSRCALDHANAENRLYAVAPDERRQGADGDASRDCGRLSLSDP